MTTEKYDIVGCALKELVIRMKKEHEKEVSHNLATFISINWHHCPFSDNCGINWDECTGWGSSNCMECIIKYNDKLNIKE